MKEDPRNFGALTEADPKADRTSTITNPDRAIVRLLQSAVERFRQYPDEARVFWQHFFDVDIDDDRKVMESMISRFQKTPPQVRLGYSKQAPAMPALCVVLDAENESEGDGQFVGDEMGDDDYDEDAPQDEYHAHVGAIDDVAFFVYVYSLHPDECVYLHKFAKAVLRSGRLYLESRGLLGFKISGGELAPEPSVTDATVVYTRFVRIAGKTQDVVPRILNPNPEKFRITGLFMDDVVVDGHPGGVHAVGSADDDES